MRALISGVLTEAGVIRVMTLIQITVIRRQQHQSNSNVLKEMYKTYFRGSEEEVQIAMDRLCKDIRIKIFAQKSNP